MITESTKNGSGGIALMMMVGDEERILRQNVLYHRYLGVERFYVFLDGTTDRTAETILDLDFVSLSKSLDSDGFMSVPRFAEAADRYPHLQKAVCESHKHYSARQVLSAYSALESARESGMDWLGILDADELLAIRLDRAEKGILRTVALGIDPGIQQLRFPPLEVVPSREDLKEPFADAVLFKTPRFRLRRKAYDPIHDRHVTLPAWLGHRKGKSMARISAPCLPRVHDFQTYDGRELTTRKCGSLLHYQLFDFPAFRKWGLHQRTQPDRFLSGYKVPLVKRLWRDVINQAGLSEEELRQYYEQWVVLSDRELAKAEKKSRRWGPFHRRPWLVQVDSVAEVFEKLQESRQDLGDLRL